MRFQRLSAQHTVLLQLAAQLTGLATMVQTRDDAEEALTLIESINEILVDHLMVEDNELYPQMVLAPDPMTQKMAHDAFADMGIIFEAWSRYRQESTFDRILEDTAGFANSTQTLMEALNFRIAMENDVLYPAAQKAGVL